MSGRISVTKWSEFDGSIVSLEKNDSKSFPILYDGKSNKNFQSAKMVSPFGVKSYSEPIKKTELTLSPYNNDKNNKNLVENFDNLREVLIKLLASDSKKFLGKKLTESDIRDNFYPFVRVVQKNDREYVNLTYRVPEKDGKLLFKIFEKDSNGRVSQVMINEENRIENYIRPGTLMKTVFRFNRLWVTAKGKIGITCEISQIMLEKRETSGWLGADSDSEKEEEEETSTPVVSTPKNTPVQKEESFDESSDDEDKDSDEDEDDDEEDDESEPEPEPVKKSSKPKIAIRKKK